MKVDTGPPSGTRRKILVVANETMLGDVLHAAVRSAAGDGTPDVLVVAPALNSRLRHWISDVDRARRGAEERLQVCLERLAALEAGRDRHLDASGRAFALARARPRPPCAGAQRATDQARGRRSGARREYLSGHAM
jgi:hypothetical protein